MNDAKYRGSNGLTPNEALGSVPDNMGEAARDLLAAELYGTEFGDFISALGDLEIKYRRTAMTDKDGGPAFPVWTSNPLDPAGMTLREYAAIKLSAAWVIALSQRHNEEGYSDNHCKYVANKRAIEQADALIEALQDAGE